MKIDRKMIISNTKTFLFVMVYIMGFGGIFGQDNMLIGVTIVTAILMFMQRDLTSNLGQFFLLFLGINLMQGVFAFISNINIFLGIPLTFISMFITGYLFTYNLKAPMYIAFGLQYLFMLYYPTTLEALPMRLLGLAFGALSVMIAQVIFNRNRLKKVSISILPHIAHTLSEKIAHICLGDYDGSYDEEILKGIKSVRKAVLERRQSYFHTTVEGKISLNISIGIERINILADRIYYELKENKKDITEEYRQFLIEIKDILIQLKNCAHSAEETKKEIKYLNDFINKYKEKSIENISSDNLTEMIEIMDFISHNLEEAVEVSSKEYRKIVKKTSIPEIFKSSYVLRKNFHIKSVKFTYAFRSAMLVTVGYGIVNYFNLPEGRWLLYTLLMVTQPYMQQASQKSLNRLKGTFLGALVFIILFTLIKGNVGRMVIIMLAGYLNSYVQRYDKQMIFITVSALGAAAMTGTTHPLILERLIYVSIGVVIAFIANKILLPYRLEDAIKDIVHMYNGIIDRIKLEIELAKEGSGNIQNVRNLIMQTSIMEDRLYQNISSDTNNRHENIRKFIEEKRVLVNDLYDEYLGVHSKVK